MRGTLLFNLVIGYCMYLVQPFNLRDQSIVHYGAILLSKPACDDPESDSC